MAHDPADLSPLVRQRCLDAEASEPTDQGEITAWFRTASERVRDGEEVDSVMGEASRYKAEMGLRFFVPEVLRCIVLYNISVKNFREERVRRARAADRMIDWETGVRTSVLTDPAADDAASAGLMGRFHSGLAAGRRPSDALREARVATLSDGFVHPFTWAPFVLYGAD